MIPYGRKAFNEVWVVSKRIYSDGRVSFKAPVAVVPVTMQTNAALIQKFGAVSKRSEGSDNEMLFYDETPKPNAGSKYTLTKVPLWTLVKNLVEQLEASEEWRG